jgi:hypothetical protein
LSINDVSFIDRTADEDEPVFEIDPITGHAVSRAES